MGTNPDGMESPGQGMAAGLMDFAAQYGTIGDQMQQTTRRIANSITGGIGSAITGVITKTKSWGEAFREIGRTILSTVIQAIVKMAATEIAQRMAVFLFKRKLDAGDVAANASKNAAIVSQESATAAATTAAWTPAAMLKSIVTFGAAALIGMAILMAVMGGMGGFATGGHTGPGRVDEPRGIVHAGEWVAPQWMVKDPEVAPVIAALEQRRQGRVNYAPASTAGYSAGGPVGVGAKDFSAAGGSAASGKSVQVILLDDARKAKRLQADPEMESMVVEIAKRNRAEIMI